MFLWVMPLRLTQPGLTLQNQHRQEPELTHSARRKRPSRDQLVRMSN